MQHCWHPTGVTTTTGDSRAKHLRCCNCGASGVEVSTVKTGQLGGHGPFYLFKHLETEKPKQVGEQTECVPLEAPNETV